LPVSRQKTHSNDPRNSIAALAELRINHASPAALIGIALILCTFSIQPTLMSKDITAGAGSVGEGQNAGATIKIESSPGLSVPPGDAPGSYSCRNAVDRLLSIIDLQRPRRTARQIYAMN